MTTTTEPLIVTVIKRYYPDWEAPVDRGRANYSVLCPFHGESRASASVSYEKDVFKCFACDASGSAIDIVMREEGIGYREALAIAEGLSPGSGQKVRGEPTRKSGRRTFDNEGAATRTNEIRPGVRRRPFARS